MNYNLFDDDGVKNCTIFYKIKNTNSIIISITTISFIITTNENIYYKTVVDENVIIPEKIIFGEFTFPLFKIEESIFDVKIEEYFFE
jgi:hypothetical protein